MNVEHLGLRTMLDELPFGWVAVAKGILKIVALWHFHGASNNCNYSTPLPPLTLMKMEGERERN